ncbi:hypothetical protein FRC12_002344 [Ceratobasidium sp. 428]|nr:hypothetical protein FRC12_002344 [Ceratobasidium sp. 428]
MGKLSNCIETHENQAGVHEEYAELGIDMNDFLRALSHCLNTAVSSTAHRDVLSKLAKDINEEIYPLRREEGVNKGQMMGTTIHASQILECYRRIRTLLGRFLLKRKYRYVEAPR